MVDISGAYDQNAEAQTSFDPLPAGEYRAKIIEAEIEDISKTSNKGRCLKLTWQIETGQYNDRLVWQRLNMWGENMSNLDKVISIAQSQFAAIRHATGKLTPQNTNELLHIPCTIKVIIKTDPSGQYDPQNEIKAVKVVGGSAPATNTQNTASAAPSGGAPWPRKTA